MIKITKQLHNQLVDSFTERAKNMGYNKKQFVIAQQEFFSGAVRIIDLINGGDQSAISPMVYFSILRGETIKKYEIPTTKEFKVVSVSSNTNSFGLHGVIMVARDGESYQGAKGQNMSPIKRGDIITVPLNSNEEPEFYKVGFEIPSKLANAPKDVIDQIWKEAKERFPQTLEKLNDDESPEK